MNTRDYKSFAPNSYYHVYNRGNGKDSIFKDDEDYLFFLSRLEENLFPSRRLEDRLQGKRLSAKTHTLYERKTLPDESFELVCYCLMPNHYHLLIKQTGDVSVAKLISKVCTGYSKYFNKKYSRVGHLFQDKFKAAKIDENDYIRWLSAYIHQNPHTAHLVRNLKEYPWSSYKEYMHPQAQGLCKTDIILGQFTNPSAYNQFLKESAEIIAEKKAAETSAGASIFLD